MILVVEQMPHQLDSRVPVRQQVHELHLPMLHKQGSDQYVRDRIEVCIELLVVHLVDIVCAVLADELALVIRRPSAATMSDNAAVFVQ